MANILLIGSTDLTLKAAEALLAQKSLCGIVSAGTMIGSLRSRNASNIRYVDLQAWCAAHHIPYLEMRAPNDIAGFQNSTHADAALAVGYHALFPDNVLKAFPLGVFGIHASLLPALRGWSPLNWALLLGMKKTGLSLFKIEGEMDAGPIFCQKTFSIEPGDDIADLIGKCADAMTAALPAFCKAVSNGTIKTRQQNLSTSSFCLQRCEEDSKIDWTQDAEIILRLIRASSRPYHGAYTAVGEKTVRIYKARLADAPCFGRPGQIFRFAKDSPFHIQTGKGAIALIDYTIEGVEDAATYLRDHLNDTCHAAH